MDSRPVQENLLAQSQVVAQNKRKRLFLADPPPIVGNYVPLIITFGAYLFGAQLTRILFFSIPGAPAVILLPVGIPIAMLLLFGYCVWPAILLASLFNGFITKTPLDLSFIVAVGNTVQATAAFYVLKTLSFEPKLRELKDVLLIVVVGFFATLIGPAFRILGGLITDVPLRSEWQLLWLAGILSVIILTPLIVRWASHPDLKRIQSQLPETILAFLLLIAINFVLHWTTHTRIGGIPVAVIQIALLGWIAIRMGMSRMTLALFITVALAMSGLYFGSNQPGPQEFTQSIIGLQLYIITIGIICYVITAINEERDMAFKALLQSNRQKNVFIATIAHELRNPLTPITNHLWLMQKHPSLDEPLKENIEVIGNQVKKITRLLEDLLDVSRIERGKIELRIEHLNLNTLVQNTVENCEKLFPVHKNIAIHLPQEPILILADPLRIEQIIFNLVHNAMKYTGPDGKISVSCFTKSSLATIKVTDDGIGIPRDMTSKIFEAFVQGDNATIAPTRLHEGLGIGLKLSKTFAEMHGGSLTVESEGKSKGSTFVVTLPLSSQDYSSSVEQKT